MHACNLHIRISDGFWWQEAKPLPHVCPSPVQPYHANQTTEIWCIELPSPPPLPVKMIGILLSSFYPPLLYVPVENLISHCMCSWLMHVVTFLQLTNKQLR
jgi:hypothetical protein